MEYAAARRAPAASQSLEAQAPSAQAVLFSRLLGSSASRWASLTILVIIYSAVV